MTRFAGFPLLEPYEYSRRKKEGWGFNGIERVFIGSTEGGHHFISDKAALAFVRKKAAEGSKYHQQALAYVTQQRLLK